MANGSTAAAAGVSARCHHTDTPYTNAYSTTTTHSFTTIKEILLTQTGKKHQERRLTPERHFESIIQRANLA